MPDDTTSVFDEQPEPSPIPSSEPKPVSLHRYHTAPKDSHEPLTETSPLASEPKTAKGFKLGVMLVLSGHILALILVCLTIKPGYSYEVVGTLVLLRDLSAVMVVTVVLLQWAYVIPLIIFGLVQIYRGRGSHFLLGVLLTAVISLLMIIPLCGIQDQISLFLYNQASLK